MEQSRAAVEAAEASLTSSEADYERAKVDAEGAGRSLAETRL